MTVHRPFSPRKLALTILILGGALSLILQVWLRPATGSQKPPLQLKGILLPEPRPLKPFTLINHHKKNIGLDLFKEKWTFLFFGYTHCPDVCPVVLAYLAEVFTQLKETGGTAAVQALFVSVDPQRDTPELLSSYVPYFNPDFLGATGSRGQILSFTRQMGAHYMISPEEDEQGNYLINHSAAIFLIDPHAQLTALFYQQLQDSRQMADRFEKIRQWYQKKDPQ